MTRHSLPGLLLLTWLFVAASPSWALVDPEGALQSGQNDAMGTAIAIGTLASPAAPALQAHGWISTSDPTDVDFFRFTVANTTEDVYLDIDLADDPAQLVDLDDGADTALWLFDASGRLIASNDDSEAFALDLDNAGEDPGSDALGDRDALVGAITLPQGDYWVAVAWYGQAANAEAQTGLTRSALSRSGLAIAGASSDDSFTLPPCTDPEFGCAGAYRLSVRTFYVPEPTIATGTLSCLALLARLRSRRR